MTEEKYKKWTAAYRGSTTKIRTLSSINKCLTIFGFLAYPILLMWLMYLRDSRLVFFILIPGTSFVLVTFFRKIINKPRPYEALQIDPLIVKEKKGQSFPSRHVFSIFLIGACWFIVFPPLGILLFLAGIALSYIRVIGGVHYPIDVLIGAIWGILSGFLLYLF